MLLMTTYRGTPSPQDMGISAEEMGISAEEMMTPEQKAAAAREQKAVEIAQRHLAGIPEQDRAIRDPKDVTMIFYLLRDAMAERPSGVLSSSDFLGNGTQFLATEHQDDIPGLVESMRTFKDRDAMEVGKISKMAYVEKSRLPDSVKRAVFGIIAKEGENNLGDLLAQAADLVEAEGELGAIGAWRGEKRAEHDTADKVRQMAIVKLLEGLYPNILRSEEMKMIKAFGELPYEERENPERLKEILKAFLDAYGDQPVPESRRRELGGASVLSELPAKLNDGGIKTYERERILEVLESYLKQHIAEREMASA